MTSCEETHLPGVLIIRPDVFRDGRGFFLESYNQRRFAGMGIPDVFVQDNHSRSSHGVLRGIHYQAAPDPMAKLVRCTAGSVYDVAVDLRAGSPALGLWHGVKLTEEGMTQVFIPPGFGHAFLVLSDWAEVQYKTTGFYNSVAEGAVSWDDPDLRIDWPIENPILSEKDGMAMSFQEYLRAPAFQMS